MGYIRFALSVGGHLSCIHLLSLTIDASVNQGKNNIRTGMFGSLLNGIPESCSNSQCNDKLYLQSSLLLTLPELVTYLSDIVLPFRYVRVHSSQVASLLPVPSLVTRLFQNMILMSHSTFKTETLDFTLWNKLLFPKVLCIFILKLIRIYTFMSSVGETVFEINIRMPVWGLERWLNS